MLRTFILLCATCLVFACDRDKPETPAGASDDERYVAPDNSGVNQRDQRGDAPTPLDQGGGDHDIRVTKQIRQAIVDHEGLGFTAKNVKVITEAGRVVLRGPVETASERTLIERIAIDAAGAGRVDNQLEVTPNN